MRVKRNFSLNMGNKLEPERKDMFCANMIHNILSKDFDTGNLNALQMILASSKVHFE